MNKHLSYAMALVVALLCGCTGGDSGPADDSAGSTAPQPLYDITFRDSLVFGSTDEHLVNVRGWGNVITDKQDRLFIPDYANNVIHVFDASGQHIAHMGGTGKGPGMYTHMSAFDITPDHLYLYDRSLFKIDLYDLDALSHSRTIKLDPGNWEDLESLTNRYIGYRDFYVRRDGHILMGFHYRFNSFGPGVEIWERGDTVSNNTIRFHWLNQDGEVSSDAAYEQRGPKRVLYKFRGDKRTITFEFTGEPLHAMSGDGIFAKAWTTEFEIELYTPDGDLMRAISYPFEKAPINRETLIEEYKNTFNTDWGWRLEAYKTMEMPDTWHAIEEMFLDDRNRLWVAAVVADRSVYRWFVFNKEGELLARFNWSREKPIEHVRGDYMYTAQKDDSGVRYIVRYKMELESI